MSKIFRFHLINRDSRLKYARMRGRCLLKHLFCNRKLWY